ncbi:MAG: hypothetical protein GY928_09765, partial [Colwellia sp.]|nr:hypothetical protein [Colwellia sp.]
PALGRFINGDPIGFRGGDVNFYVYVQNNPVNFIDPEGEFAWFTAAIGVFVGAAISAGQAWLNCGEGWDIVKAAGIGALAGSVAGLTLNPYAYEAIAAGAGIAANVAQQTLVEGASLSEIDPISVGISAVSGAAGGAFTRFGVPVVNRVDKVVNAASGGITAGAVNTATNIRLRKNKRLSASGCGCP